MKTTDMREGWKRILPGLKRILLQNFGLKVFCFICAVSLWCYVIYSSDINTEKTLTDVPISIIGQSTLESNKRLVMLTDSTQLGTARIRISISQASYSLATTDNVHVDLDLSNVRREGKQSIMLKASTTYGKILSVYPKFVEVEIETKDQREVPVNVELSNKLENMWYNVTNVNPSKLTVSGAATLIQSVSQAVANVDLRDKFVPFSQSERLVYRDSGGNNIVEGITSTSGSVLVYVDAYPTKELLVDDDVNDILIGEPEEGFQVESVTIVPPTVTVAAEQSFLDTLEQMNIEQLDITGATGNMMFVSDIVSLSGIRNLSSDEVSVAVNITEKQLTHKFPKMKLELAGETAENTISKCLTNYVDVIIEGPYTKVLRVKEADIHVSVDQSGLSTGVFELPVDISMDRFQELTVISNPATVVVNVTDNGLASPVNVMGSVSGR